MKNNRHASDDIEYCTPGEPSVFAFVKDQKETTANQKETVAVQNKLQAHQMDQQAEQKEPQAEQKEPQADQKEPQADQNKLQMDQVTHKRTLGSLVSTPLKKVMFGVQILSYFLIVGSPLIGGIIGRMLDLTTGQTAGVILGVFIAGEILFYGSLAFLGRGLLLFLRERVKGWFRGGPKRTK